MRLFASRVSCLLLLLCTSAPLLAQPNHQSKKVLNVSRNNAVYNVMDFGAIGDGKRLDTAAIQAALDAANEAGGGEVWIPSGVYLSFSLQVFSHITLKILPGATLLAANPNEHSQGYHAPEPNIWGDTHKYQDFGHSHFRNSLIWGEDISHFTLTGGGLIDGSGLWKGLYPPLGPKPSRQPGNKTLAIKGGKNIALRDINILRGGHFAVLATGINNLLIDSVIIDSNRDGIDIDVCKNVRINNVVVNSPNDNAIVLKSSFVLGAAIPTENVTISNSIVSGYDVGTVLDGTYQTTTTRAPDGDGPTGRIKLGTESNGGFHNITLNNIVFDRSRGLAIETVDGGSITNVVASNLTMRDVSSSPIFIRLGARLRGPTGIAPGRISGVKVSNVIASNVNSTYPVIIAGLPGSPVENVTLKDIRIEPNSGLTWSDVEDQPDHLVNPFFFDKQKYLHSKGEYLAAAGYPEPSMFGVLPAYGAYILHGKGINLSDVEISNDHKDTRAGVYLAKTHSVSVQRVNTQPKAQADWLVIEDASDVHINGSNGLGEVHLGNVRSARY